MELIGGDCPGKRAGIFSKKPIRTLSTRPPICLPTPLNSSPPQPFQQALVSSRLSAQRSIRRISGMFPVHAHEFAPNSLVLDK